MLPAPPARRSTAWRSSRYRTFSRCSTASPTAKTSSTARWGGRSTPRLRDERHGRAFRNRAAGIGERAGAQACVLRAPSPTRLGFRLGDRLCPALCGGVPRLRCVSNRLRAVDGQPAFSLRRPDRRPDLPDDGGQYPAVCRRRREFEDVPRLAVVRLLPAAAVVDQGLPGHLPAALAPPARASLHSRRP